MTVVGFYVRVAGKPTNNLRASVVLRSKARCWLHASLLCGSAVPVPVPACKTEPNPLRFRRFHHNLKGWWNRGTGEGGTRKQGVLRRSGSTYFVRVAPGGLGGDFAPSDGSLDQTIRLGPSWRERSPVPRFRLEGSKRGVKRVPVPLPRERNPRNPRASWTTSNDGALAWV